MNTDPFFPLAPSSPDLRRKPCTNFKEGFWSRPYRLGRLLCSPSVAGCYCPFRRRILCGEPWRVTAFTNCR